MKRKSLWIGVLIVGTLAAAALAQNIQVPGPVDDGGCVCPQNYDPVVCRAKDGSSHTFPNLCVATCAGYTNCAKPGTPPEVEGDE